MQQSLLGDLQQQCHTGRLLPTGVVNTTDVDCKQQLQNVALSLQQLPTAAARLTLTLTLTIAE